ncbi:hypothetical protein NW762_014226 [Fusarium torreyae]|uniref:Methyltransferase domain-containing protein n=1 Tax=Fusarium torreyae TaxID=1237075 RepID=A0A9W8RM23_9HYPO|nr:hypothetical protein NW762_014226 [Fusarium torreyae]
MSSGFQPKQITQYEASRLVELMGNISEEVIEFSLDLIPPFKPSDVIHDNACGAGTVSQFILEKASPSTEGLHIDATDINPQFIAACEQLAQKNNWPLKTQVMDVRALEFPDSYFTHSFNNLAYNTLDVAELGLKESFRTLKPGGVVMVSTWNEKAHNNAIKHASRRTRGEDSPLPLLFEAELFEEERLKKALNSAGFDPTKTKIHHKDVFVTIPDMKRWAQLAWSYLGFLPSGWSQGDEEKWDEAVNDLVEQLASGPGISKNEKGETVLKYAGCIAIATK